MKSETLLQILRELEATSLKHAHKCFNQWIETGESVYKEQASVHIGAAFAYMDLIILISGKSEG